MDLLTAGPSWRSSDGKSTSPLPGDALRVSGARRWCICGLDLATLDSCVWSAITSITTTNNRKCRHSQECKKPKRGKPSVLLQGDAGKWHRENPVLLALLVWQGITAGKPSATYTCSTQMLWPWPLIQKWIDLQDSPWNMCVSGLVILAASVFEIPTPHGAGVPPFRLCSSLVHSLPLLLLFVTFPLFLFSLTLLIFFYCPSDPFLPESSHSVSRRVIVAGDWTWV